MYKIVSKVLANKLKKVLLKDIDEIESTFIGGRNILDDVLVTTKTIDEIKTRMKKCVIIKIDFEKTYDTVRWDFIYYMIERL